MEGKDGKPLTRVHLGVAAGEYAVWVFVFDVRLLFERERNFLSLLSSFRIGCGEVFVFWLRAKKVRERVVDFRFVEGRASVAKYKMEEELQAL